MILLDVVLFVAASTVLFVPGAVVLPPPSSSGVTFCCGTKVSFMVVLEASLAESAVVGIEVVGTVVSTILAEGAWEGVVVSTSDGMVVGVSVSSRHSSCFLSRAVRDNSDLDDFDLLLIFKCLVRVSSTSHGS